MNRKIPFMMTAALLLGAATLPGVSVRAAEAADGVQAAATQEASPTLSDQFFRVEWTVSPGRDGNSRLTGYVYNQYGGCGRERAAPDQRGRYFGPCGLERDPARIRDRSRRGPRVLRCAGPEQPVLSGRRAVVRFPGTRKLRRHRLTWRRSARSKRAGRLRLFLTKDDIMDSQSAHPSEREEGS